MTAAIKSQLLEMPDLPLVIQYLQRTLDDEREKRAYFYEWVTEDIKAEFINGKIIEHSPVAGHHWESVGWLHTLMNTHVGQADSGRVASEKAMISLTRNDYEPDIVFWKKEKSDQFLPEQTHYPAPDLVVEVLSKGTASRDRVTKFNDYAAHGVSEYWMRLAQVDLQMGAYGEAYAHLSRAHELDRTAVAPLSMMTELAVISGRLDMAENHLKKLVVIAPNDRAVAVARGFVAIRQANYEKAQENVDLLLAQNPRDSIANILQTRILVAQKKIPEAIELLNRKLALGPDDRALLRSLGAIHRYLGDWGKAAATDLRLWRLSPSDATLARQVVTDALQAKDFLLASKVTERVMISAKAGDEVDGVLSAWADLAPSANSLSVTIGANMPEHSRVAYAHYLNRVGRADQAVAVLGGRIRPLNDRANAAFNAVFAESLFLKGQVRPAREILDRILSDEPVLSSGE